MRPADLCSEACRQFSLKQFVIQVRGGKGQQNVSHHVHCKSGPNGQVFPASSVVELCGAAVLRTAEVSWDLGAGKMP